MLNKRFAFVSAGVISICMNASAQQELDLDPVTVTSSISPLNTSKTGRNIVTIKGEQFNNLPVNSIDELLRYLPGLEIQARGPMGVQSDFVIRGGTFQQVLVVLDGMRLNDPLTGHFNSYIPISPAEIDRIEVLKGASSAIYGSEAVGGVIHIITKTFAARKEKQKQASAQFAVGEYGLINGNIGGFYNNGKTAVGGGFMTNNADGQQQRGTRGFFNLNTASASVSHRISDNWDVALRSGYDDRKFGAQNFYTRSIADTANEQVTSFWNTLRVAYQKNNNKLSLNGGYKKAEDRFAFNSMYPANANNSSIWQGLLQYEHRFAPASVLTTGAQYVNRQLVSNNRGNHQEALVAGFATFNHTFNDEFTVSPAIRLDWNENRGAELVPQLNLSYNLNIFQFRGSIGKTIRDADFTERYNNYNQKNTPNMQSIGNPDLEAERSLAYEAGVDIYANKLFKVSASYFKRDQENLIDYVYTPYAQIKYKDNLVPGNSYALAKNIYEVNTRGIETDVQFTKALANKQSIWSSVGLVWLKSKSSEANPSFYILSHARFQTNFTLQYATPRFRISTNGIYKNRAEQPATAFITKMNSDYFVINGKAEVLFLNQKLGIFTQVDNIFDENYSDLFGAQMPGRWLLVGAKFTL
ncbi:TonB-dependent receptor plug domain-containing protein [Flavisolibacter tropicus]|nr:TonB-dependent receptor [Flavisolibacter tropicus]